MRGLEGLEGDLAAISARLGLDSFMESMPFLISRMALTSSTRPLSQLLLTMRRLECRGRSESWSS
jgi:hypothetical protein